MSLPGVSTQTCAGPVMKSGILLTLKCGLLLLLVVLTNQGLGDRLRVLVDDQRLLSLAIFILIWMISIFSLLTVAFLPGIAVRIAWAIPLGLASAAGYGYYIVQGAEFTIFDVLSFWTASDGAGEAYTYFSKVIHSAAFIFALFVLGIVMPPSARALRDTLKASYWAPLLPVIPVLLIAGVVVMRDGKGSQALPMQFSPLSLSAVATYKIKTGTFKEREAVSMTAGSPLSRAIVLIVDESIRADFMTLEEGNPTSPELASLRDHWVNFGPAVSAGNCSYLSNAILRFMADRRNLVETVHTSPTVWDYAREAGYRTVFIDAQPTFLDVYGKLQNLMTPAEALLIDDFHELSSEIKPHLLDDELVRIILEELVKGDRVFIYANKNGAHFPYASGSPDGVEPDGRLSVSDRFMTEIYNYAKAIKWSTDRTMALLIRDANWDGTTMIYTADHGQNFSPGRLTHCTSSTSVNPDEAIVPLMVASGDQMLRNRFSDVAARYPGHGTHFAIAPTLLELMGYPPEQFAEAYEGSLLTELSWKPRFVADDLLGLFSQGPTWHEVDPMVQARPASPEDFGELCGDVRDCKDSILH